MSPAPVSTRISKESVAVAIADLERLMPGQVTQDPKECSAHTHRLTWIAPEPPDGVVSPRTREELAAVVRIAGRHQVPLIAFGGGTSLEGHVNAPYGGLSVDFSKLDRICDVNLADSTVRVEAGVTLSDLNAYLKETPVFFSVDPGAGEATLGGMAATRASGSNTVRYGTMRDNVLSVEAVMSDGSIIETATSAPKSSAGYDLTRLLVGSEGTLGLITALTLRLHPVPQEVAVCVAGFETLSAACDTVINAMQSGLKPARIEFLDEKMLYAVNLHSGTTLKEAPTLFIEIHGRVGETQDLVQSFRTLAKDNQVQSFVEARGPEQRAELWAARKNAFLALTTAWPGSTVLASDVCVPLSRLAAAISEAQELVARLGLTAPIVGHVGDGNFHVLPAFDNSDQNQRKAVVELLDSLVAIALRHKGTCSGEHGIGQGKVNFLEQEAGAGLATMRTLKRALDPLNILNPGKIFVCKAHCAWWCRILIKSAVSAVPWFTLRQETMTS